MNKYDELAVKLSENKDLSDAEFAALIDYEGEIP